MPPILSEETKRLNTIRFINAARELIDSVGLENVSVRKIAEKAGFHNSTIYLYFEDAYQLVLLASLKYFKEYNQALSEQEQKQDSPIDSFFAVWQFFCDSVFRKPRVFYNFFFGKHSDDLTDIIVWYYSLFPEEKAEFSGIINDMYYARNIRERCLIFLETLVDEPGTCVTQENLSLINDIIVSCLRALLEDKRQNLEQEPALYTAKMLEMLHYIVKPNRLP